MNYRKTAFHLCLFFFYGIAAQGQSKDSTEIYLARLKKYLRKTYACQFAKIDTLSAIRYLPFSPSFSKKTAVYYQYQQRYFMGLLVNFLGPKEIFPKNQNQHFFVFDAQTQNLLFFPNALFEMTSRTDSITSRDLFLDGGDYYLFNSKRRYSRSIQIIYYKENGIVQSAIQIDSMRELNKKEALDCHVTVEFPLTRARLANSTVVEMLAFFQVFTKDYYELDSQKACRVVRNPRDTYYIRQFTK